MRLLSNNVHQNNISVFYACEEQTYYKIASEKIAVTQLKQERRGWDWYFKNILQQPSTIEVVLSRPSYYKIAIQEFPGEKVLYSDSFENNFAFIERVVDWYIEKWPKGSDHVVHGDFTLDNIIFGKNQKIYLIDWECFSEIKAFWGYDILYFILSAVFLPKKHVSIPSPKELVLVGGLFSKLFDSGVPNEVLETPLASLYDVLEKKLLPQNKSLSKNKFFPLCCSDLELDVIDECFVRAYRYAVYNKYLKELSHV